MTNLLDLPDYTVLGRKDTDFEIIFSIRYNNPPLYCPRCGVVNPPVTKTGTKKQLFNDLPVHAKRVGLQVVRQKYRCKECKDWFAEHLPGMHESRSMTQRAYTYIQQQSLIKPFTTVAKEIGVDEKLVRIIFKEHTQSLAGQYRVISPEWLGIDEVYLLGKYRCVITNIKERTIIDLLKSRTKATVTAWLQKRSDRARVKYVTMDMWQPYREAVQSLLPDAVIIVDKYHILSLANVCLESVRKATRDSLTTKQRRQLKDDRFILLRRKHRLEPGKLFILEAWTKNFPSLGEAYDLKEGFYDIWELAADSKQAFKLYDEWKEQIPPELAEHFKPLTTAVGNWSTEIFAYFDNDHKITNAYTENINGFIKVTNQIGRGYSFDAVRAKAIYNGHAQKLPETPLRKRIAERKADYVSQPEPFPSYGSDISLITIEIESLTPAWVRI